MTHFQYCLFQSCTRIIWLNQFNIMSVTYKKNASQFDTEIIISRQAVATKHKWSDHFQNALYGGVPWCFLNTYYTDQAFYKHKEIKDSDTNQPFKSHKFS